MGDWTFLVSEIQPALRKKQMADLTNEEMSAGFTAAKNLIDATVTGVERTFITDAAITAIVAVVVAAVDKIRAEPAAPASA